jgi:replicative DNA helicase
MARKIKIGVLHEQIVIGSMLSNKKTREQMLLRLGAGDFAAPRHRAIFAALAEMQDARLDYVPATLKSFLPPNEDDWGGTPYLVKLEEMHSEGNIDHHIERMRWDNARSGILNEHLSAFEVALKDPRLEVDEALTLLKRMEEKVKGARSRSAVMSGAAVSARYMATLYAREDQSHLRSTGYLALDRKITNPFGRGLISIITAAPSIGKTTFSLNMAKRQARKWKVGVLAWESGSIAATDIMVSSELGIPLTTLVKNPSKLTRDERNQIEALLEILYEKDEQLSFLKRPPKSVLQDTKGPWEINDRVLDWFAAELPSWDRDIIYWDLFEKMLPDRRPQAISWALDRAQEIAHDYGVHLALLHQVTFKDLEKQKDKRPSRGYLKGSGGYIEVPDMVYALYRRAVYEPGIEDNEIEIYCIKQRIGPWPWRIICDWDGEMCQITGGREAQLTIADEDDDDGI